MQDFQRGAVPIPTHSPELLGRGAPGLGEVWPCSSVIGELKVPPQTAEREVGTARQHGLDADEKFCMQHGRAASDLFTGKVLVKDAELDDAAFDGLDCKDSTQVGEVRDGEATAAQKMAARLGVYAAAFSAHGFAGFRVGAKDDAVATLWLLEQVRHGIEEDREGRQEILVSSHDQAGCFLQQRGQEIMNLRSICLAGRRLGCP